MVEHLPDYVLREQHAFQWPLARHYRQPANTDTSANGPAVKQPTTGTDSDGRPNEGDRRQIYGVWNTWTKLPDGQHGWISDGDKIVSAPTAVIISSARTDNGVTRASRTRMASRVRLPLLVLSDESVEIRL